ncbi:FAD binding domain-containing protein [Plantactinospora solaniradicis]|uniref:FAD binding domain-containing protein n=1 Tax=Plantactinospora solaniradicis TaxID=1723736 RepID=A0ABW1KQ64_9ACTN
MDFLQPTTWSDALALRAEHPDALPVAGGTDVMVELNFARRRPPALLDLSRVAGLAEWDADSGLLRLGAGVPYRRIVTELAGRTPGLAMAARTIGSPQIRNRGTIGGNLGSASPAGDALPPLLAAGAMVELASVRGVRTVPVAEFCTGPKRSVLAPDELIAAILLPTATGPEQFAKVGARNAMVIAVCSFALVLRMPTREVGIGIGSAAPTPVRAPGAEDLLRAELPWGGRGDLPDPLVRRFGELVAAAASPIDDVRGTAAYRRHALGVLGRRSLVRAWDEQRWSDFSGVAR